MKNIFLICSITFICGCSNNRLEKLENHVNLYISEQEPNTPFTLVLDTISSFKWDELLISGPYTDINRSYPNYNFSKFPNILKSSNDKYIFFGFIHKKKGVKYFKARRCKALDSLKKNIKRIVEKENCKFLLKN